MLRPQLLVQSLNAVLQDKSISPDAVLDVFNQLSGDYEQPRTGALGIVNAPELISKFIYLQQPSTSKIDLQQI